LGYYIEVPQHKGKAQQIVELYGGRRVSRPQSYQDLAPDEAIICVVDNGLFEAAAFCYNEDEFNVFAFPDGRSRAWVVISREKACELSGYKE